MTETDACAAATPPATPPSPGGLPDAPVPGVSYPLKVTYCGACSLPLEYCEFSPDAEACKKWLQANLPDTFEQMKVDEPDDADGEDPKKSKKRGGKGTKKKSTKADIEAHITLQRSNRGKNKCVTVIKGMKASGCDLKEAAKLFSKKFAASSSVTGDDEIVVQGDVKDDLFDFIPDKWPSITEDAIEDLGEVKR